MNIEVNFHKENCIWKMIVEVLNDRHVFKNKWVYKFKREIDGKIIRFKARWVIRNFKQREDFDYNETFVAIIKLMNYKIIFAIIVVNDWDLKQINVIIIFFYEDVEKKIYMKLLIEYKQNIKICRLRKAFYDLKQFSRMWYNIFASFFKKYEFVFLDVDLNVFFNKKFIIVIYIDDILLIKFNSKHIVVVKRVFNEHFKMIDLNSLRFYLNINIERNRSNRILFLNQKIYLKKIFKNHGMWKCKLITIFMNNNILKVVNSDHVVIVEQRHAYQFIINSLMYVMLKTRFNLVYVVFVINKYVFNFIDIHWKTVKRIFRYIRKTLDLRLIFSEAFEFFAEYINVDWGENRNTRRFTFKYVFNVKNEAINWSFKRQSIVILLTCEAEYMSQTQAVKEVIWLLKLLKQINLNTFIVIKVLIVFDSSSSQSIYSLTIIIIYCDNQKIIALVKNFIQHFRTKHIDIQQHFVREKIITNEIELQYVFITE